MIKDLKPLVEQLHQLHLQAYRQYLPEVDALIKNKIKDDVAIQALLDGLLDFCADEQMLLLFKKTCRYYWYINPKATADYINYYRETFDSESYDK